MSIFGLGKKPTTEEAPGIPPSLTGALPPAPEAGKVHEETVFYTMPAKFLTPETPPFWTSGKIWGVVILLAAGVVGAVYLLLSSATPPTATNTTNTISSASPAPPTPEPSPAEPSNALTNEPAPPETPTEPPVEPPPTEPAPTLPPATQLPSGADTDADGLTDAEEILYGTDTSKPDSDGDGFTDKQELVNGYNPAGSGRLIESVLVKTYTSATTPQFTINYPAAWTVERVSDGEGIRFIASPDEFMSVSLQPNSENLFILDWYKKIFTNIDTTAIPTETLGKHIGIFSPDRQTFYFIDADNPAQVFVTSYNSGTKTELSYRAAFELLIGSITLVR